MSYVNQNVNAPEYTGKFQTTKDYILYSLGWPLIRVELEDSHLTLAIVEAVTLWYKRSGLVNYSVEVVTPNENIVDIPDGLNPNTIKDVLFNPGLMDSFSRGLVMAGDEDVLGKYVFPQHSFNNLLDNFDMVGYYLFTQRLEDFRKLVGIDRTWEILNKQIALYPAGASFDKVGIVYRAVPEDIALESEEWIKRYALAKAKHMLATVRGKLSGFDVTGGNIGADADTLRSEAKEEMAELKEELNLQQMPLPFMAV